MSDLALEATGDAPAGRDEIREAIRLRGSNINSETLLATDYLNHFNEIVMMIEMAADMPDMFELTQSWEPLGYEDHFTRSNFSDRQLAVDAYRVCPDDIRAGFDGTVAQLDELLVAGMDVAASALSAADDQAFHALTRGLALDARTHIDRLSAIIHGRSGEVATPASIDSPSLEDAQSTIDSLFD